MKKGIFTFLVLCVLACKKDDPKPPDIVTLIFPEQNSECTTGVDLNATTSQVEFRWQMAAHTDTYELRVTNLSDDITQTVSTASLSALIPLVKGAPYSWIVISRNDETTQTAESATWQFYNAGSQTTYAPFPAQIVQPGSGKSVVADINNEVSLSWIGADVESDIVGYQVYFETATPPSTLVASPSGSTTSIPISVMSNTVYYWKVITIDEEGNTSDSGIYSFKVL